MSLLHQAPRLTTDAAERLARDVYAIEARAQPLPSERDQNFLLEGRAGRFVLKLANRLESRELLEAQNAALQHVAARVPCCPRVLPGRGGDLIARDAGGHLVRLVTWLPGRPLAALRHHPPELLADLGARLGELDRALVDFDHAAFHRDFHWDLAGGIDRSRVLLSDVRDDGWRGVLTRELDRIEDRVRPRLTALRRSIIHNDANDYNVLVEPAREFDWRVSGIIDFGDMVHSYTVANVAVGIAYTMLGKSHPLDAAAQVLAAYHRANPLLEDEIGVVFDLAKLRLCLSASVAAGQQAARPGDDYLGISQEPIRATLPRLIAVHPRFAEAALRRACGLDGVPRRARIRAWLRHRDAGAIHTPFVGDTPFDRRHVLALDLGVSSPLVAGDPQENLEPALTARIDKAMREAEAAVAVGGYLEPRILPGGQTGVSPCSDPGVTHLGLDFFARPGTIVRAPLAGVVHAAADNLEPLDYGPVIVLRHTTDNGDEFFTLYGHLARESLDSIAPGMPLARGECIGVVGAPSVNGGWTPHLHFQLITDLLDMGPHFPGVCRAADVDTWAEFSPDPNLIARVPETLVTPRPPRAPELARARRTHIGPSVRLAYRQPLRIARGWMQYLYDEDGRRYIDGYNNVPHAGHCHPAVVSAAEAQMRVLNTNTRYLHEILARFGERLGATLPPPLRVCYFVNSGSEANELALRLARAYTRAHDVIVLDSAYHGLTTTLTELSPYKFNGPGGSGKPSWVHVARLPDVYRGPFRDGDPAAGRKYADDVAEIVDAARASGRSIAAFLAESAPSVAGQIMLPEGYLEHVYPRVRDAGGVCIADEVQTAYGRVGTHFYAFEAQRVIPDIVVLGKPIGNGFPLGAVVTTPEIARAFDTGMEFFSTFGGSTVSCAVGLAVLEICERDQFQLHAHRVGALLLERLRAAALRHPSMGDVRGAGLFLGVDLVTDRQTRAPATALAEYVVNRLREEGVLIGTDGPHHNVLKIRPPMPFDESDAEELALTLDRVLSEGEEDGR